MAKGGKKSTAIPKGEEVNPRPSSDTVQMVNPGGELEDVPISSANDLAAMGYQEATPEYFRLKERKAKFGGVGGQIASGLLGTASGATVGLSNPILAGAGVSPHTLKDLAEENPIAYSSGEIVGTLAPVVGELGLAAKAGKAVGSELLGKAAGAAIEHSPAGLVTKLGAGIEGAVSRSLGGQIAGKFAGAATRGAAEAELYNLGNNISEATLGDEGLTAERLLAHSGDALEIGAGLGLGITAGGVALRAVAEKAGGSLKRLSGFVKEHRPLADPDTLNAYAEKTAASVGMEPDDVKRLLATSEEGAKLRESLGKKEFVTPEERDRIGKEFRESLEEARAAVNGAKGKAYNEIRPKEIGSLVKDADEKAVSESAYKLHDDMRAKIAEMKENPDLYSAKGLVSKMEKIADGYEKRVLAVGSTEELYNLINDTRGMIGAAKTPFKAGMNPEFHDTVEAVDGIFSSFKSQLTDESLWGEAAARHSLFNDSYSRLSTAETNLFGKGKKVGQFGYLVTTRSGGRAIELDTKKINTFMSQTTAERSHKTETALREYIEAAQGFVEQVEASSHNVPEAAFDRSGVDSLISKTQDKAKQAADKLGWEAKVRQAARADDLGHAAFPGVVAGAMSAVVGHPIVGAVGGAANAAGQAATMRSNPIALAKTLARVESFANGPAKKMSSAIDSMLKLIEPGKEATKRASQAATREIVRNEEDPHETFAKQKKELAKDIAAGSSHAAQLQSGFAHLAEHAPKTQLALVSKQMQAKQFIHSKMPQDPFVDASLSVGTSFWKPSGTQLSTFQRYNTAARDPVSVINDAARGVVSAEGIETLNALYPGLLSDYRSLIFDKVATKGRALPYSSAIAMSKLFDVPLVSVMRPDVSKALQANFAETKEDKPETPNIPHGESKTGKNIRTAEQERSER